MSRIIFALTLLVLSSLAQTTSLFVAKDAAEIVRLNPNAYRLVALPNGTIFSYDANSATATNSIPTVLKPTSFPGRWLGTTGGAVQSQLDGKVNSTNGIAVGLTNRSTGSTTFRSIDDRFSERKNVLDFGAIPGDGLDDTLAIRAAITAAISNKTSVFIPAGIFNVSPQAEAYIFTCDEVPSGGNNYNSLLIEGVESSKRLSRIDTTPHQTYSRGTVLKVTGNMAGKVVFQSGQLTRNVRFRQMTVVGTGLSVDSIGFRHSASSSYFDMEDVTVQHFRTPVDLAGDWPEIGKLNGDFITLTRVTVMDCEFGLKNNSWASYPVTLKDCDIAARIPVYNLDGVIAPSAQVNVIGGFYAPLTENGGILVTGLVVSATSSTYTITNLAKFTKSRDVGTFVLSLNRTSASISDITTNMFALAENNVVATGAARVPDWAPMNSLSSINSETWTVTVGETVDTTAVSGSPIYFVLPSVAFYGGNFNVIGAHVEQAQAADLGFGSMFAFLRDYKSHSSFRNVTVQLASNVNETNSVSRFNRIMPVFYHKPTISSHPFSVEFDGCRLNMYLPKFEVSGGVGVRFKNNAWYSEPLIIDHTGIIAEGVTRTGEGHFLKMRIPYELSGGTAEYLSYIPQMGPDSYEQRSGLLMRPFRSVSSAPTTGASGEIAIKTAQPNFIYRVGNSSSGVSGYFSSAAIGAGTASIEEGSSVATVTNLTGLSVGRVITIAGAGVASGDLTARIVDLYVKSDASQKLVYLSVAAGTTASAGLISPVSITLESSISAGRPDATTRQLYVAGGADGADIVHIERDSQIYGINMGGGSLNFRDATTGSNLLTLTPSSSLFVQSAFVVQKTNTITQGNATAYSAVFTNGVTMTAGSEPSAPAAGKGEIFMDTDGGKVRLRVRFPSGVSQTIATEP